MDRKTLFAGKHLDMVSVDGWEFAARKSGVSPVGIVAVTAENKLLLISQFRVPINKTVIEIPASLIGDSAQNESWQTAARRELEEETGWTAESFEKLTEGPTSAGLTSECVVMARAINVRLAGEQHLDGSEKITVHEVPMKGATAWLRAREAEGIMVDPKVWVGLFFLGNVNV